MNEPIDLFGDQEFSSPLEAARYAADFVAANPEVTHFYLVPEKVDEPKRIADLARRAILGRKAIAAALDSATFILPVRMELMVAQPGQNMEAQARTINTHRFALLDLMTGTRDRATEEYLLSHGVTPAEYAWFMDQNQTYNTVFDLRSESEDASLIEEYLERYGLSEALLFRDEPL